MAKKHQRCKKCGKKIKKQSKSSTSDSSSEDEKKVKMPDMKIKSKHKGYLDFVSKKKRNHKDMTWDFDWSMDDTRTVSIELK